MRPVRVTGVTGTSAWVPLDTYAPARAGVSSNQATLATEYTFDNVFDTTITPQAIPLAMAGGVIVGGLPEGARAVRGTGMISSDIMVVSQQAFS